MTFPQSPGAGRRRFSWRGIRQVLWPDLAKLQMEERDRRLLPALLVGHGFLSAVEALAGGLLVAILVVFADGRPFMYAFAVGMAWMAAFGVLGLLHGVRIALWVHRHGGREDNS